MGGYGKNIGGFNEFVKKWDMIKIIILLIILFVLLFLVVSQINNIKLFKRIPKMVIAVMLVSLVLTFVLSLRFINNIESKGTYVPAEYDGENLIPGKVEFEE